jgi:ribonuclease G
LPEWLVERGIGETRAALVEGGEIVEARIELDGVLPAGTLVAARLTSIGRNGRNAVARDEQGREYLLPNAPAGLTEGASLNIEILRESIPGAEPWKRPLARSTDAAPVPPRPLEEQLAGRLLPFPAAGRDELSEAGWSDVLDQASSGIVVFDGGALRLYVTPAMTLIDVDGHLPADKLAVRGAREAARAIRRLGIGGSIGIDLPTVGGRGARQSAAAAIDEQLPQPFERTAVNGFGFVQIVRPRRRASLLEIWTDRPAAEARALLRRVAVGAHGAMRLVAHPAVIASLEANPAWIDALARQIGGSVGLRSDPSLPISAGHGEKA